MELYSVFLQAWKVLNFSLGRLKWITEHIFSDNNNGRNTRWKTYLSSSLFLNNHSTSGHRHWN